jgi:hypothetical protein
MAEKDTADIAIQNFQGVAHLKGPTGSEIRGTCCYTVGEIGQFFFIDY